MLSVPVRFTFIATAAQVHDEVSASGSVRQLAERNGEASALRRAHAEVVARLAALRAFHMGMATSYLRAALKGAAAPRSDLLVCSPITRLLPHHPITTHLPQSRRTSCFHPIPTHRPSFAFRR